MTTDVAGSSPAERLAAHLGEEVTVSDAYGLPTVDVPAASWTAAAEHARDALGATFFDWLSAVDELDDGFRIVAHLVCLGGGVGCGDSDVTGRHRMLLRTLVPRAAARVDSLTALFPGASWHERETAEMFGIDFAGHPNPVPLLLPDGFEGNPLRKEFVLAARAAKAWPGAKEPGESDAGGGSPSRRKMAPPGVPDPDSWGPRPTGTAPKEPAARPARGPRAERPARRERGSDASSEPVPGAVPGAAPEAAPGAGPEAGPEGQA